MGGIGMTPGISIGISRKVHMDQMTSCSTFSEYTHTCKWVSVLIPFVYKLLKNNVEGTNISRKTSVAH